jgi:hypothetical protein
MLCDSLKHSIAAAGNTLELKQLPWFAELQTAFLSGFTIPDNTTSRSSGLIPDYSSSTRHAYCKRYVTIDTTSELLSAWSCCKVSSGREHQSCVCYYWSAWLREKLYWNLFVVFLNPSRRTQIQYLFHAKTSAFNKSIRVTGCGGL